MKVTLRRNIGVSADTAAAALTNHYKKHGRITARKLVDESTPEDAPLHPCFEWDDEKAADNYRLYQGRNIVRSVHVIQDDGEDRGCMFVRVVDDGESAYMPTAEAVKQPDLYLSALAQLRAKLENIELAISDLQRWADSAPRKKQVKAASRLVGKVRDQLDAAQ